MNLSFKKLFYPIAIVIALFAVLILAKTILIPLGMAMLISFILFPLAQKFESWKINRLLAAFLSILTFFLIIGGAIFFFSTQIIGLSQEFSEFREKIMVLFADIILFINNHVSFETDLNKTDLLNKMKDWLMDSAGYLAGKTFNSTTSFLAQLLATIIYTFLILIYRTGLTNAFIKFSPEENRVRVLQMFKNIQKVGQKYLSGMLTLIIILGLINSIGLWIIGVDSPFLFGFLAASLSIIPYIGTTFGASIPVLYAFMSHDSLWVPFAVFILFWSVQIIETNFLNPKIVGSSVKVNALASILSLIIGGMVWGVAGMILFLPFAAILKVICDEFDQLKPIGLLIGNQNLNEKEGKENSLIKWIDKLKDRYQRRQLSKTEKRR